MKKKNHRCVKLYRKGEPCSYMSCWFTDIQEAIDFNPEDSLAIVGINEDGEIELRDGEELDLGKKLKNSGNYRTDNEIYRLILTEEEFIKYAVENGIGYCLDARGTGFIERIKNLGDASRVQRIFDRFPHLI